MGQSGRAIPNKHKVLNWNPSNEKKKKKKKEGIASLIYTEQNNGLWWHNW
jgi:hypothetical protein